MDDKTIKRPNYLDEIQEFIDKPEVKIITGLRRSGKTELLKMIRDEIKRRVNDSHIVYMNFEDMDFESIASSKELNSYLKEKIKGNERYYILFDEIQLVKDWEKSVNGLRLKNCDIYITGSNSKIISEELATLLGGRTVSFRIHTLSFKEFVEFRKINEFGSEDLMAELEAFIRIGGFPRLSVIKYSENAAREVVKEINSTALLKDVVVRHKIRQPQLLDKLVAFLYDNVGNLFSVRSIVNYMKSQGRKADPETIANYMHYLEDGFLIQRAQRYDVKGRKLLETNDKYYLSDHSQQYAVRGYREDKIQGILENIVFNELVRCKYKVYVGKFDTREIDFVAEKLSGEKIYVQVCLEFTTKDVYEREFGPLKEIKDNFPKYVVSLDKFAARNDQGIIGINLKDFLLLEK